MDQSLHLMINIDGASRGNPGPAAYGFVIYHDDEVLLEDKGVLGETTNNVAEYQALIKALQKAHELNANSVNIRSDSELMVKQMKGKYKVNKEHLQELYKQAKKLSEQFDSFNIQHVYREDNRQADKLCNEALNLASKNSQKISQTPSIKPDTSSRRKNSWQQMVQEAENLLQESVVHSSAASQRKKFDPAATLEQLLKIIDTYGFLKRPNR